MFSPLLLRAECKLKHSQFLKLTKTSCFKLIVFSNFSLFLDLIVTQSVIFMQCWDLWESLYLKYSVDISHHSSWALVLLFSLNDFKITPKRSNFSFPFHLFMLYRIMEYLSLERTHKGNFLQLPVPWRI